MDAQWAEVDRGKGIQAFFNGVRDGNVEVFGRRALPAEPLGGAGIDEPPEQQGAKAHHEPLERSNPRTRRENNGRVKKIAVELDLPEEASVEDILGAIGALKEATAEAQEAEAEAILNSEGGEDMPPEEKEMMKEELIKNRARALRVLKNRAAGKRGNQAIKTAAVYARPIMNRAGLNNKADKTRKALSI